MSVMLSLLSWLLLVMAAGGGLHRNSATAELTTASNSAVVSAYWHTMLPNTPMPSAILELLTPPAGINDHIGRKNTNNVQTTSKMMKDKYVGASLLKARRMGQQTIKEANTNIASIQKGALWCGGSTRHDVQKKIFLWGLSTINDVKHLFSLWIPSTTNNIEKRNCKWGNTPTTHDVKKDTYKWKNPSTSDDIQKDNYKWKDPSTTDGIEKDNYKWKDPSTTDDIEKDNYKWKDPSTTEDIEKDNYKWKDPSTTADVEKDNFKWGGPSTAEDIEKDNYKWKDPSTTDDAKKDNFRWGGPSTDAIKKGNHKWKDPSTTDDIEKDNYKWKDPSTTEDIEKDNYKWKDPSTTADVEKDNFKWGGPSTADDIEKDNYLWKDPSTTDGIEKDNYKWKDPSTTDDIVKDNYKWKDRSTTDDAEKDNFRWGGPSTDAIEKGNHKWGGQPTTEIGESHIGRVNHKHGASDNVFLEQALKPGSTITSYILPSHTSGAPLLRRDVADSIPMSTRNFTDILTMFAPGSNGMEADIWSTLERCEHPDPIKGETKACATSVESMVELVTSVLGAGTYNLRAFSSPDAPAEGIMPGRRYKVAAATRVTKAGDTVTCHGGRFPFAVFMCHTLNPTRVYSVTLEAENDGTPKRMEVLAICHLNTSGFDPARMPLHVKPGDAPLCHLLSKDSILWAPAATSA